MRVLSQIATLLAFASAQSDFEKCSRYVSSSTKKFIKDDTKLKIYGLYKQATLGDCDPNMDTQGSRMREIMLKEWCLNLGKSQKDAQREYVAAVDAVVPNWRQLVD
jgi:diazepam-binding inhibitor (GABA receptor modulating acyl-CoA-binding protein)